MGRPGPAECQEQGIKMSERERHTKPNLGTSQKNNLIYKLFFSKNISNDLEVVRILYNLFF